MMILAQRDTQFIWETDGSLYSPLHVDVDTALAIIQLVEILREKDQAKIHDMVGNSRQEFLDTV